MLPKCHKSHNLYIQSCPKNMNNFVPVGVSSMFILDAVCHKAGSWALYSLVFMCYFYDHPLQA